MTPPPSSYGCAAHAPNASDTNFPPAVYNGLKFQWGSRSEDLGASVPQLGPGAELLVGSGAKPLKADDKTDKKECQLQLGG